MKGLKWSVRLLCSLQAAIAGWLAGVIMTLPVEASIAWRNTDGQPLWMAKTLFLGVVVWGIWTLVFSLIGWLLLAVPLVLMIAPAWLRPRKGRVAAVLSAAAFALPGKYFGLFSIYRAPEQFDAHNFLVYSVFGVSYALVSPLVYLRLVERAGAFDAGSSDDETLGAREQRQMTESSRTV